jgi:hypothetical protein
VTNPVDPPSAAYPPNPQYAPTQGQVSKPARTGNLLGLVALIVGVVLLMFGFVMMLVQGGLIAAEVYDALGAVSLLNTVVSGLLAAAAIVLGAVGLAQRGRPKALAGIGLGIGAAVLVSVFSGVLYSVIVSGL